MSTCNLEVAKMSFLGYGSFYHHRYGSKLEPWLHHWGQMVLSRRMVPLLGLNFRSFPSWLCQENRLFGFHFSNRYVRNDQLRFYDYRKTTRNCRRMLRRNRYWWTSSMPRWNRKYFISRNDALNISFENTADFLRALVYFTHYSQKNRDGKYKYSKFFSCA